MKKITLYRLSVKKMAMERESGQKVKAKKRNWRKHPILFVLFRWLVDESFTKMEDYSQPKGSLNLYSLSIDTRQS